MHILVRVLSELYKVGIERIVDVKLGSRTRPRSIPAGRIDDRDRKLVAISELACDGLTRRQRHRYFWRRGSGPAGRIKHALKQSQSLKTAANAFEIARRRMTLRTAS